MSEIKYTQISNQLPQIYREIDGGYIPFLEKYYEYLHRNQEMGKEEIDLIKENLDFWLSTNIDNIIANHDSILNNIDYNTDLAITLLHSQRASGNLSDNLIDNYLCSNIPNSFITTDDEYFETSDQNDYEVSPDNLLFLKNWYKKLLFPYIDNNTNFFIKLIRPLQAIKGSLQFLKLFFDIFFDEQITIYIPKYDLATLDNNFNLDSVTSTGHLSVLRDDNTWNEYSIIINVLNSYSYYQNIFENIYLKYFHSAGFKIFFNQVPVADAGKDITL